MLREQIAQILWVHFPESEVLAIYNAADALKKLVTDTFGPPF